MHGRVLALLVAGLLSMGAISAPPVGYIPPDRHAAEAAVAALSDAALDPAVSVRALARQAQAAPPDVVGPPPAETAGWWAALPRGTRALLTTAAPGVIGDLEGLPYAVRDRANRILLARMTIAAQQALREARGKGEALLLGQRVRTLQQVATALTGPGPRRLLVTLDPVDAGRAAIAIGDPQTASYVDFLVPGMYFTVRDQIVDWTNTAATVQSTAAGWLRRFHDPRTVSVISWIGYRTPDAISVFGLSDARDGAVRLADAVDGLRQARGADRPFVGVLAHSYGATAALLALQAHAFAADALAMVGAPGSPASSAAQLDVPAGRVYVGQAELDNVATSGFFGSDPAAPAYGATALGAKGGRDPLTGVALAPAVGHNGYFARGTESLRNIALVAIDRGADVTDDTTGTGGVLALSR